MELNNFLVKAKKATYAGNVAATELPDGSKQLQYMDGTWTYVDTYKGSTIFYGRETVGKDGAEFWVMQYMGKILNTEVPVEEVYAFLREALLQVTPEMPYRGPAFYRRVPFSYEHKYDGKEHNFRGQEVIRWKGMTVFILDYHGGKV